MKRKIAGFLIFSFLFFQNSLWAQGDLQSNDISEDKPIKQGLKISPSGLNDKITLDIKGMDILDVLKMIASRSGMNIVVGKNVTGKVTLFLKDVGLWDAFEIILLANDLAYTKKGDIVNVMTQRDYELLYGERYKDNKEVKIVHLKYAKAVDLAKSLNQIKTNIGRVVADENSNTVVLIDIPEQINDMLDFIDSADLPVETKVFALNYAQADKLLPKIQELITKGMGSVKIDERTNKVIVTDYPERLGEISRAINAFDEKTRQVLIDAQIIEIKPTDKFQMGVNWDYWIRKYFQMRTSLPINTSNALFFGTPSSETVTGRDGYKAIIDVLRTIGDLKILSSPRIIALNNQEAKILVGTKDAYITSSTSQSGTGTAVTAQTVNFVDTGVKLYVTPTINKDGFVTMKIKPEVSSAKMTDITSEDKVTQVPIVTTSESETTLMVKDGVTIIMGGLRKDSKDKTEKRIPILANLPLLGALFKSTTDDNTKSELVILLTPHIISGEDSYTDFAEIPPKNGAVAKMVDGEIVIDKIKEKSEDHEAKSGDGVLDYKNIVNERIRTLLLMNNPKKEKGEVKVSFILDSIGQIQDEPIVNSSDNQRLENMVVRSIKNAAPFPPFPQSWDQPQETFVVTIKYK